MVIVRINEPRGGKCSTGHYELRPGDLVSVKEETAHGLIETGAADMADADSAPTIEEFAKNPPIRGARIRTQAGGKQPRGANVPPRPDHELDKLPKWAQTYIEQLEISLGVEQSG